MPDIFIKSEINSGHTDIVVPRFEPTKLYWNILHIKQGFFDQNSDTVWFDNVSYGHRVYKKNINEPNQLIHDKSFPIEGLTPLCTDQEYEESTSLYVDPENTYIIEAWFQNAGKSYSKSVEFITPAPPDFESEYLVYHPETADIPPEYETPLPPGALEQVPVPDYETPAGAYKHIPENESPEKIFTQQHKST